VKKIIACSSVVLTRMNLSEPGITSYFHEMFFSMSSTERAPKIREPWEARVRLEREVRS
jgi:hypothetical protein